MTKKTACSFALTLLAGLAYVGSAAACGGDEHEDKDESVTAGSMLCGGDEHEDDKDESVTQGASTLCGGDEHEDDKDES
jgi:hypothetical protein